MSIFTLSTSEPTESAGKVASETPSEQARLMAEFAIAYNGRHYEYGGCRYDHLADAVNYAKLNRSKSVERNGPAISASAESVEVPDEKQRQLMAMLSITFQGGAYRFGAYRYDRLTDAVSYARMQHQLPHKLD